MTTNGFSDGFRSIATGDVYHYAPWRPVVNLTDLYQCPDCSSSNVLVDRQTGDYVCPDCGRVLDGVILDGGIDVNRLPTKTYSRVHHYSERDKQWAMREPSIPDDIFACIEGAFVDLCHKDPEFDREFQANPYRKNLIQRILREVRLSPEMQEKYRSVKFKKTPFTDGRLYEKYCEKWKTICYRLTEREPKIPSLALRVCLKTFFLTLQKPFEFTRHASSCTSPSLSCHKTFGCRYKFFPYDFVILKGLYWADKLHGFDGCYDLFKDEFDTIPEKKKAKLELQWREMMVYDNNKFWL